MTLSLTAKYINEVLINVKPLTYQGIREYFEKSLKKYYSERKVRAMERAQDYIIRNYIEKQNVPVESDECLPF